MASLRTLDAGGVDVSQFGESYWQSKWEKRCSLSTPHLLGSLPEDREQQASGNMPAKPDPCR